MKIGLIDVDSHNFPNLALMKISAWHKNNGDKVDWWNGLEHYDKVYISKVFDDTYTKDMMYCINADEVIRGGTGYDLKKKLPIEVEHMNPDYSLYPRFNEAYGYLTRGCPRGCTFCVVGKKEGLKSVQVADLGQFWNKQKIIKLLDPNLLACKDSIDLLQQLINCKAKIDFTQGLDIRCMTDKKAYMINKLNLEVIHFAWDNYEFKTYEKLKKFRPQLNFGYRKLKVYVLTNYNTTLEQDLERIYKLKELEYDPFVMIYDKPNAPKDIKRLQGWVNNKIIFRSGTCNKFEEFNA